jgi:predicted ribosomally synthesized peptide with SipW-like signal peptide
VFGNGKHDKRVSKRLLVAAGSVAVVAAAAALGAGVTFGFFSATSATQTNQFSAGKVTLTSDTSGACNIAAILPGTSPSPCTLKATYSGTVSAYMGLDVLIETQAGSGGSKLYNPADSANDLQVTITDNQGSPVTYTVPTTATTCPLTAPAGSTCYELDDELVNLAGLAPSTVVTFSTAVSLPTGSATGYQGGKAQIILTAHAVQAANNGSTASCLVGHQCDSASPSSGAPRWS